jgi:ferric-dicitrate binding protein FerR (iron transport regulator)
MRCERYEQGLTAGAAGGTITPDLEAHLDVCAACRDWRAEKQAVLGYIDQVLTSHLDVEPSPALRSRVISRVAQAEGKRRRLAPWAAAAALAAGLGIALLAGGVARHPPDAAFERVTATGPTIRAGGAMKAERAAPVPPVPTVGAAVTPHVVRRRSPPAAAGPAAALQPEVLVPPGQEEALRRFVAGLREEPGTARPLLRATATVDSPVPPPPLIHIPVLASEPLSDPADPLERSKS